MYIAATQNPVKGKAPSIMNTDYAESDSRMYGSSNSKTLAMAMDPGAKIGDYRTMQSQLSSLPSSNGVQYGYDVNAYNYQCTQDSISLGSWC